MTVMKITCPCCRSQHEVAHTSLHNWYGDEAGPGEVFATAWCHDAGREVGDWVPESPAPATKQVAVQAALAS